MLKLTKLQKKHYSSIKWLLFGKKAEGKTCLLAHTYIQEAKKDKNCWVTVRDHYPRSYSDKMLLACISNILEKNKIKFQTRGNNEFRISQFR